MKLKRNHKGITLAELLVALMVTSIVFTAVVTLAYAIGSANDASDDTVRKQAKIRYATLRIEELIRHSKLVYSFSSSEIVFWKEDTNEDGLVGADEMVYVDSFLSDGYYQLRIREGAGSAVVVLNECNNIQFSVDSSPPWSRYVGISILVQECGVNRQYEMSGSLRGWSGNLLDAGGNIVSDDD